MNRVQVPFTEDQVAKLREWQTCGWVHPFTCGNRDNHIVDPEGVLVPYKDGWYCPELGCDYHQDWAWSEMFTPPTNPLKMF